MDGDRSNNGKDAIAKQVLDFQTFRSPLTSDHRRAPTLDVDTPKQYDFKYPSTAP